MLKLVSIHQKHYSKRRNGYRKEQMDGDGSYEKLLKMKNSLIQRTQFNYVSCVLTAII